MYITDKDPTRHAHHLQCKRTAQWRVQVLKELPTFRSPEPIRLRHDGGIHAVQLHGGPAGNVSAIFYPQRALAIFRIQGVYIHVHFRCRRLWTKFRVQELRRKSIYRLQRGMNIMKMCWKKVNTIKLNKCAISSLACTLDTRIFISGVHGSDARICIHFVMEKYIPFFFSYSETRLILGSDFEGVTAGKEILYRCKKWSSKMQYFIAIHGFFLPAKIWNEMIDAVNTPRGKAK